MRAFTSQQVRELAAFSAGLCVSIYMPTQSIGQEVLDHADRLLLKNQLKEVTQKMKDRGFAERPIRDFLDPLQRLADDVHFWRARSKGLAIFLASDFLHYFHLPISLAPLTFVGYEFYLKPLLKVLADNGEYFLLSLNLQQVELFRGDRDQIDQVIPGMPIPQTIEEVTGSDYRPKFQGARGGKVGGHSQHGYYGQGEWQEDEKQEILQFFRAVHQAIAPTLRSADLPLVLTGLDHLVALYRQVENFPRLQSAAFLVNPKDKSLEELHRGSWKIMAPYYERDRRDLTLQIQQLQDSERVVTSIQDVIPAAIGGRIKALFLDKAAEIWGVYHPQKAETVVQSAQHSGNTSLINLAAVQTFLQGGQVFVVEHSAMPLPFAGVNALFRF
jgi:hypothetical protein